MLKKTHINISAVQKHKIAEKFYITMNQGFSKVYNFIKIKLIYGKSIIQRNKTCLLAIFLFIQKSNKTQIRNIICL